MLGGKAMIEGLRRLYSVCKFQKKCETINWVCFKVQNLCQKEVKVCLIDMFAWTRQRRLVYILYGWLFLWFGLVLFISFKKLPYFWEQSMGSPNRRDPTCWPGALRGPGAEDGFGLWRLADAFWVLFFCFRFFFSEEVLGHPSSSLGADIGKCNKAKFG